MLDAAEGERFEEAAQLRDAMRTVQTLHDRQQKMATAELGHRDVFGLKLGPAGVVDPGLPGPQRPRRRAHRARHRRRRSSARATARCSRRRSSSSTSCAARRPRSTCRPSPTSARRSRRWLSERAAGASASSCRSAARSAASSISPTATRRSPIRRASTRRRPRSTTRSRRCRHVLGAAGAAAADRVLRHLDDSGQRDRRVDGRLRGRPDAARRVSEISGSAGTRASGVRGSETRAARFREPSPSPESRATPSRTTSPRCTKSCCAAIASCSSRADRFRI